MSDRDDRRNTGGPVDERDVDRGDVDPDVIRPRDTIGAGGEGDLPAETEESPLGRLSGHVAAGNTPVATSGGFGGDRDLFPPE